MTAFNEIEGALETAKAAVEAASQAALSHFRAGVKVERKEDRSPVTIADREAEAAAVGVIERAFPGHSILGEESGRHDGDPGLLWIIDPIDGTRGFIGGGTAWGPLVALQAGGEIVAGAMALPAEGLTYWGARGMGAFRNGERLRLSTVSDWPEVTLSLGELTKLLAPPHLEAVSALVGSCAAARCEGDIKGAAMLLDGRADVWLEAGVKIWDLAPLKILVEEAGGRFTNFKGEAIVDADSTIASNGLLHEHVLRALMRPA